ncbi:unnamed protein product, partial [marine sediment metagenome]
MVKELEEIYDDFVYLSKDSAFTYDDGSNWDTPKETDWCPGTNYYYTYPQQGWQC